MTQLECIYLMNVALYLPIQQIPTFRIINKKCKDAIDGLKINPITSGIKEELKTELNIINDCFPQLETFHLHHKSCQTISENPQYYNCDLPIVDIYRINKSFYLETNDIEVIQEESDYNTIIMDSIRSRINTKLNRISYHPSLDLNNCPNLEYLTISNRLFFQNIEMIESLVSSKRLKTITVEFPDGMYKIFDKEIERILFISKKVERIVFKIQFPEFIEDLIIKHQEKRNILPTFCYCRSICDVIDNIFFTFNYSSTFSELIFPYTFVTWFCDMIERTENDSDLRSILFQTFDKIYYPKYYVVSSKYQMNQVIASSSPLKTIYIMNKGTYKLPKETYDLYTNFADSCEIENWNDLNQLHHIYSFNYNVNTPKQFYSIETNLHPYNEKQITITSLLYFILFGLICLSLIITVLVSLFIRPENPLELFGIVVLPFVILFNANSAFFLHYLAKLPQQNETHSWGRNEERERYKNTDFMSYIVLIFVYIYLAIVSDYRRRILLLFMIIATEKNRLEIILKWNGFSRLQRVLERVKTTFLNEKFKK